MERENHELYAIPGMVPDIHDLPDGCRFSDRCFEVQDRCRKENPVLTAGADMRRVSCHFPLEKGAKLL